MLGPAEKGPPPRPPNPIVDVLVASPSRGTLHIHGCFPSIMEDEIQFNGCSQRRDRAEARTFERPFDPRTEPVSEVLSTAIASIKGERVSELPVLQNTIKADVLDDLLTPHREGETDEDGYTVFFQYATYEVCVDSSGVLTITEATDEENE